MFTVQKHIVINISREKSWEKLRDLSLAKNYIPGVREIEIISEHEEGLNAHRKAYLLNSNKVVDEYVTEWSVGQGFRLKLDVNGKRVIPWYNEFYFEYNIEDDTNNTLLTLVIIYEPRYNFCLKLQSKIHKHFLGRELKVICAAIKEYYENSSPISSHRMKAIRREVLR